ncbi:uncharacterized protein LOC130644741 [Hydractinia symbiolongicarpus]|uniref:uncharacterized protein LOC130644741 n=1 Tax=Hydractinia symbiolongicarpus TaxID=13093 RepID=UPI00255009E6|nr:uncharacterized protein LOC130644741 [Hydractinia symbiolongicarpus]
MLLRNIHKGLPSPSCCTKVITIKGDYDYYHYSVDEFTDQGWGCGYRTLQSIVSWLIINVEKCKDKSVPSITIIQETLVAVGDKCCNFIGSKEWIGSFEVFLVLDHTYKTSCKLNHVNSGNQLGTLTQELMDHFSRANPPIMMGGDVDAASKGIVGIATDDNLENTYLLIMDPHFTADRSYPTADGIYPTVKEVQELGFIKWIPLSDFCEDSFYNLCIPIV